MDIITGLSNELIDIIFESG